jgi:tripartite-type tricarboxylate transporter receptor subunit TctC
MGGTGALAINPGLRSNMPYDPLRDFSPISLFRESPLHPCREPVHSGGDRARADCDIESQGRGKFNYASTGVGSPPQLAAELFKSMTATDLIHIPY